MAKHSKGKHGKPKAGPVLPFGRRDKASSDHGMTEEPAETVQVDDESESDAVAHAAHAQKGESRKGSVERTADEGSEADAPQSVEDAGDFQPEKDDAEESKQEAKADEKGAEGSEAKDAEESSAEPSDHDPESGEAPSSESDEAKASQGKHAQGETQEAEGPEPEAFMSSADLLAAKKAKRKKIAKRIGIGAASAVGVAAAVYLVGVAVFSTHFMPNTHIDALDLSFKTPEEVQSDFDAKVGDYTIKVKGNGLNIAFTSKDAGLKIDSAGMTQAISAAQNPWEWPIEVFYEKDMTSAMTDSLTASRLGDVVNAAVAEVNETAKDPVNAYIEYDPDQMAFDIIPEVPGTKLDADAVLADILVGAMNLDDEVIILDDDLIEPDVYRDDKRLVAALASANDIVEMEIPLVIAGTEAYKVTADDIQGWVSITPEFTAVLDEDAMVEWSEELAGQFNTVGSTRSFVRPDGKEITVSGGDYGWKVDKEELATSIADAIRDGVTGTIEVPVLQSGSGYSTVGGKDWGNRYVDVDISEQHARLYDENGTIIWEADIVSGAPTGGRATPYGVYDVNLKGRHVTLTGRDSAGNIQYETPVAYWMPFIGNSIGFHDATWQSAFGGNRYRAGRGSHGCINLSLSKAEELYGLLQVGDVVVVHA